MTYRRVEDDEILRAVISEIHKTAQTPPAGFLKREDWAKRWKLNETSAYIYLNKAVASGILIKRRYRVITKGRLRLLDHFGPPDKRPRKPSGQRLRT